MAEFNLFLGTARKSVGDVTLLRRAGRQVARVRLRHIANPKSDAQCETRNFLSPVIKFYGPLRDTLARSFEGYNKADSYNQFQRQNIALARKEGWYLTKGTPFYPMPYILSQGTLSPVPYSWYSSMLFNGIQLNFDNAGDGTATIGLLSSWFTKNGYKTGDVVTIIAVLTDDEGGYFPEAYQFNVNTDSSVTREDAFGINIFITTNNGKLVIANGARTMVAGAVIVSRYKLRTWLRSTQRLIVNPDIVANITSSQMKEDAIKSYGPYASSGGGGVYPGGDGEPFNVSTISGRALLFYGGQYNARTYVIENQSQGQPGIQVMPANVDDYFYIKAENTIWLGTNTNQSLTPADWRRVSGNVAATDDTNTILLQADTPFYRWLQSCGYTGA